MRNSICLNCGNKLILRQKKFCSIRCGKMGSFNGSWKGGMRLANGYVRVYIPTHPHSDCNGYIAQHRLVMETYLGRYLYSTEVVHHINHQRDDNRIENLELLDNQSNHFSLHMMGNKVWIGRKHNQKTIEKMRLARVKYWEKRREYVQA